MDDTIIMTSAQPCTKSSSTIAAHEEALCAKVTAVKARLESKAEIFRLVRSLTGAEYIELDGPIHCRPFFFGKERRWDPIIYAEIVKRAAALESGRRLRCLEVGVGSTYGLSDDYGYPFLARVVSEALPDRVEMVASDSQVSSSKQLACFYSAPSGELFFKNLLVLADRWRDLSYSRLRSDSHGPLLEPLDVSALYGPSGEPCSILDSLMDDFSTLSRCVATKNGKLFLRPMFDPAVAHALFGLEMKGGVQLTEIGTSISGRFDFIFGRNLSPDLLALLPRTPLGLKRHFDPVLTKDGLVFLDFDGKHKLETGQSKATRAFREAVQNFLA